MYKSYKQQLQQQQKQQKQETDHVMHQEPLLVKKPLLNGIGLLAGIDRGCTLTKILYASEFDESHYRLNFALFDNKNFDQALKFLSQQKLIVSGDSNKIRVTGTGGSKYSDEIKNHLGYDVEFVDEAVTQFAGFHFLVKNFADDVICHPPPETQKYEIELSGTFKELLEKQAEQMNQGDVKFPCLFCIFGSSAGIALVREDGSIEVKHRHLLAGKSFLGVCKLLVGTGDYNELMRLASSGFRGNIDTQVRDMLSEAPDGPYGRLPPSMALLPFGKAVDFGKTLEDTKPEDVAHSLVSSFAGNFYAAVTFIARRENVQNIYFGGNFSQHPIVQKEFLDQAQLHGNQDKMRIKFLKTGHSGAIGCMLSTESDVQHFASKMQIRPR